MPLPDVPESLSHAFEMAVVTALILPVVYLWAGKVDLQMAGTPAAYLLRTSLLVAIGLLVAAALFWPLLIRHRFSRYAHGFLAIFHAVGAFKGAYDLVLGIAGSPRTLAGASGVPGAAWLPVWVVDLLVVVLNVVVLWYLLRPATLSHVDSRPSATPS